MSDVLIPTEKAEAQALMQYFTLKGYKFTHVKNETGRPDSSGRVRNWRAVYGKQDGVSPGFPDFVVVANSRVYFIELKRTKGSRTSEEQKEWIKTLQTAGANAAVCKGAEEAIAFIEGKEALSEGEF